MSISDMNVVESKCSGAICVEKRSLRSFHLNAMLSTSVKCLKCLNLLKKDVIMYFDQYCFSYFFLTIILLNFCASFLKLKNQSTISQRKLQNVTSDLKPNLIRLFSL